ncbi:hypothetical protein BD324DRAFT_616956 [Kockovaella imperatae]|uniref:MARVEL domain-containing protein n=1 Tax=Kockovaella imperatae TaxID=4999 RepID=A0A1Y1UQB9_9TREE|nr:hypothetical protein BD324DRAFT_616956 [Kockovaella imperatae]ORX40223.1 hypothetical protein BD324DRAFT_616956 [Kockovaella imperatae]
MAFDTTVRRGHPILFGLILLFSLIEGCDTAYIVGQYNSADNYPNHSIRDRSRFLVFTSWWTVVFSALYLAFYLTGIFEIFTSIASHGVWLFITWVFWLAGAAAWSAALSGGVYCGVPGEIGHYHCHQLLAAEAFAWITWILMTFALIVVILLGSRALRSGNRLSGGLTE